MWESPRSLSFTVGHDDDYDSSLFPFALFSYLADELVMSQNQGDQNQNNNNDIQMGAESMATQAHVASIGREGFTATDDTRGGMPTTPSNNSKKRSHSDFEKSAGSSSQRREDGTEVASASPPTNKRRIIPPSGLRRHRSPSTPSSRRNQANQGGEDPMAPAAQLTIKITSASSDTCIAQVDASMFAAFLMHSRA